MLQLRNKIFISLSLGCVLVTASQWAQAAPLDVDPSKNDTTGLINDTTGSLAALSLGTSSPIAAALNLMNLALSLLGGLCLVLLVYAGFLWIWARGSEETIKKAKDIIQGTAIGLIIVLAALGITRFVVTQVATITGADVQDTAQPESTEEQP